MVLELRGGYNHVGSQLVGYGDRPGDSKLPSTTKITSGSGIRTSHILVLEAVSSVHEVQVRVWFISLAVRRS